MHTLCYRHVCATTELYGSFLHPHSTCLLLVVAGKHQYSDPITDTYRQLALHLATQGLQLGYVDEVAQQQFLEPFQASLSRNLHQCSDGVSGRPVSDLDIAS